MFPVKIYAFADEASSKLDGQILALKRGWHECVRNQY